MSLVTTTTGAAGAPTCSVTVAVLPAALLPYWSVWVALTVTVLPSPGLANETVTLPLAYVADTPCAAPVTVPSVAILRVVATPLSFTVTVALPLAASVAAFSATLATATPVAASAFTSPLLNTPSLFASLVIVTTGAGTLMCSTALAVLPVLVLPYWSVCVALTVTVLPSPGLAKDSVKVPLPYTPETPLAPPDTVPSAATVSVVVTPWSSTVTLALPLAARLAASSATVACATPDVASALTSLPESTPSWLASLVMVTTGAAGALMCSVAEAVLPLTTLPCKSVWVAETVTVLPSPGLAKDSVTLPLL